MIRQSTPGDEIYLEDGSLLFNGINLFGSNTTTTADAFEGFTLPASVINATSDGTLPTALASILNPTLALNGAPTDSPMTHALLPGSPAINASDNGAVPSNLTTDQRGFGFPRIVSGVVDIGAYEYAPPSTPTTTPTPTITPTPSNTPTPTITPTPTPSHRVSLGPASVVVHEGVGTLTLNLLLNKVSTVPVEVKLGSLVELPDYATALLDYAAINQVITFAPGETTKTTTVAINQDSLQEPTERFRVIIESVSGIGASVQSGADQSLIAIEDDDASTATPTVTSTPTATETPLPTHTPIPTETVAPTATPMPTVTPMPTETLIPTDTPTPTATAMPTATVVPTTTETAVPTDTPAPLPEDTDTPVPTNTPIPTATTTAVPTSTDIPTSTATAMPTSTDTPTSTATVTLMPTSTNTLVPTTTATTIATATPTNTDTPVPTATVTPTATAMSTTTATPVPTATATATATAVPTSTATPVPTATATSTATVIPTGTDTPMPTATPTVMATATAMPTVTATPTPTGTPVPTATLIPATLGGSITSNIGVVQRGDTLVLVMEVDNEGEMPAENVFVEVMLPDGVTFNEAANNPGWEAVSGKPNTYRIAVGLLPANEDDSLNIVATVNEEDDGGPAEGAELVTTAVFTATNAAPFTVSTGTGQNVVVEGDELTPTELPEQTEPSRLVRIFLPFIGK